MTRTTNVHVASARLSVFTPEEGASSQFATFTYGDPAHLTSKFLTVEQTVPLAAQFAGAAAAFHPVASGCHE